MVYTVVMCIFKRTALILMLFLGLAAYSYGETLYSLTTGYYRLSERFRNDDFGRGNNGVVFNFAFYHYPENTLLGFFGRTSFGSFTSGYEWRGEHDMTAIDSWDRSTFDLRICLAPSYKLNLGTRVNIPFALGPVFSFYREEFNSWSPDSSRNSYYEAMNLGIMGDASIIIFPIRPSRGLFLKQGISVGWDFLRLERGEMLMEYRNTRNPRFKTVSYSGITLFVYFGLGLKFD